MKKITKEEIQKLEDYLNEKLANGTEEQYQALVGESRSSWKKYRAKWDAELEEYTLRPLDWNDDRFDVGIDIYDAVNFRFDFEKPKRTVARQIAEIEVLDWY